MLIKSKSRGWKTHWSKSLSRALHPTQDTTWESDKNTRKHHTQEGQEASPSQQVTTRLQWTDKTAWQTQNINNKKDPQIKHCLGTVSKIFFNGGLKLVSWYQPHPYFWCRSRQIYVLFTWKIPNLWRLVWASLAPCRCDSTIISCAGQSAGPEVIKLFSCSTTAHEISTTHKNKKYRQMKMFIALSLSDVVFIMLINVKMPTILELCMKKVL